MLSQAPTPSSHRRILATTRIFKVFASPVQLQYSNFPSTFPPRQLVPALPSSKKRVAKIEVLGTGREGWLGSDVDEQSESQRRSFSCTKLSSLLAEKAQYLQRFVASLPAPVAVFVASLLARTPLFASEVVGNMPATPSPLTVSFLPDSFSETRFLTVRAASPCVDRHAVRVAHAELLHLAEAADGHG